MYDYNDNINEDDISQIADLLCDVKHEVGFQYCDERVEANCASIIYFNIRGLKSKICQLENFLSFFNYEIEIVVLVESWVQSNEVFLINFPNYNVFHSCRDGRGGGICVLVKKNIECSVVLEKDEDKNNYLVLKLFKTNMHLITVYRSPGSQFEKFFSNFEGIMERFPRAMVLGDFNLNILESSNAKVGQYLDILSSNGFLLVNKKNPKYATRICDTTSTIIDHVLTDQIGLIRSFSLEDVSFSDHRSIQIKISFHVDKNNFDHNLKIFNYKLAENSLFWDNINQYQSLNELIYDLEGMVKACTQNKPITRRSCFKQPWMTQDLYQDIRMREKLFRLKTKYPDCKHLSERFNYLKFTIITRVRKAKREYFSSKLGNCNGNAKEFWNLVKLAISNKKRANL